MDDELKATVPRNMLLGLWAAEKLGFADTKLMRTRKALRSPPCSRSTMMCSAKSAKTSNAPA